MLTTADTPRSPECCKTRRALQQCAVEILGWLRRISTRPPPRMGIATQRLEYIARSSVLMEFFLNQKHVKYQYWYLASM